MTPQEAQLLNSLIERVNQTQLQEKDPDAQALLTQSLGTNPDALYILAQTMLVQNIALEQARAQIAQLQTQSPPQPAHTTSFLGRLLGEHEPEPQRPQPPPYQPVPQYAPPPTQYSQPQYQQFAPGAGAPIGYGPPSFLRGAMQTAAGVAAGALAFEGVEAVLHGLGGGGYGWGGPGFGMGGLGAGGFGRPGEETVINNYYDENGRGAEQGNEHRLGDSAGQLSDQDGAHLSDAGYGASSDDQGDNLRGFDQDNSSAAGNFDNAGPDDTSGFNDGGGFDGGGDSS